MKRTLPIATLAMLGLAGMARASVVTYTNAAAFNAATTNRTSYSFTVPAGAPAGSTNEGSSYTSGPLTFADSSVYLNYDGNYGANVVYLGGYNSPSTGTNFTISVSGAPTAISFNLGTYNPVETVAVAVNGAAVTTIPGSTGAPSTSFLGITNTSAITSVVFTNMTTPGDEIDIVGFATGSIATVSEPASLALLSLGLFGLTATRLNARRRSVQKH